MTDVSEFARQLQTEVDLRTNRALALLTIWAIPMGIVLAAAPVATGQASWRAVVVAIVSGLLIGMLLRFTVGRSLYPRRAPRTKP